MKESGGETAFNVDDPLGLSFPQFKFVSKEVVERLKVCSSASCYMEDLAEIENSLGKSLNKIWKQPIDAGKPEFMPGISSTWDGAMKILTEFTGKHHSNVSFVISQNLIKVLSDVFRLNNKRVQDIINKMRSQYQELVRSKQAHSRRQAKYFKSVKDAELSIRQRYAALEAENRAGKDKEKALKDSTTDEKLMKSFSKMMAKIAPVDSQKRWNEKFIDTIKDLDAAEASLNLNCLQLNTLRDTFLSEVKEALEEHKILEQGRVKAVRECLTELSHLQSLICDEEKEAYYALHSKVENLKVDEEVASLLWSVDRLVINDMNLKDPSLMNDSEKNVQIVSADFSSGERARNSSVIFHKVQQTLEVLDFIRNLVNSVGVSLRLVAEAKRMYAKSVHKCFEKHGLSFPPGARPAPGVALSHQFHQNRAGRSNSTADSLKRLQSQLQSATGLDSSVGGIFAELIPDVFSDVLYRTESPTSVAVWVATVSAFGGISASHSQTAEKYFEVFLPTLSSIQRRVFAMKNDLMSKQISSMKLIDSTQAAVLKLSQKIEKVKYLIKTQHDKVEKSKEEVLGGHSLSSGNRMVNTPGASSPTNIGRDGDEDGEATSPSRVVSGCPSNDDDTAGCVKEDLKKEKEGDMRGKASKIMLQGLDQFGSRLQKARMTVVAGLGSENHEERLERREGRMIALECEERELLTAFYSATANMDNIEENVRMDIDSCLKAAKEVICHDISSFVDILQQLSMSQKECVACFEGPVKAFQSLCDALDAPTETLDFISSVHSAFRNSDICCKDEDKNIPSETPTVTYFTPLYNKTIEDEKASLGIFSDLSKYDLSRFNSEHEGERDRLSPINDFTDLRIGDHEEDLELSDDKHSGVFSIASASGSEVEPEVSSLDRSNGHHLLQSEIHHQLLEQQSLVEIALNRSSQLENASDHFQPINPGSSSILTFEEHSVTEVQSISNDMTEIQRTSCTTTTTKTQTQSQAQVDPQSVVNELLAEAMSPSRLPSARDISISGSRDVNSASPTLSLPLNSFHSPSRDGERVHFRDYSSVEKERGSGRDDLISVDVKRGDINESLIAVSEMLKQNMLTDDSAVDRSFEGSAASGSSVSSACMSPAALPPRPPRPPKVKRSGEKEKEREKEKDTDKEKEKERIGQYMMDVSSVSDKSVFSSPNIAVNKIDTTRLTADGRAPVISKSEDNLFSAFNQNVKLLEKREGAASTEEAAAVDSVSDSTGLAEGDEKASKDVLSSREFLDSPKVMRLKERPFPTMSAEGTPMTVNNATVGVNKKVPQIMGNKPEDSSELVKFGLSPSVRVLETFSCALYPKKGLLTHGRIFITQHYLAFSGWPEMRLLLALKDINNVEKCNTLYYIPNAISINSETYGEFFFGSFIDRDVCYALLNNMSQIAKRLIEIKRDSNTLSPETEQLVFGLRIPKTTGVESYVGAIQAKATAGWNSLPTTVNSLQELSGLRFDDRLDPSPSINPNPVPKPLYLAEGSTEEEWSMVNPSREELNQMQVQGPSSTYSSSNTSSSSTAATTTTAASAAVMIDDFSSYKDDGIDISDLFTKHGIQSLCTQVLPFRFPDLLRSCWLHGSGYGDFLTAEGDLDIGYGDWAPLTNPKVPEDVSGLPFSFAREFHYSHPRTTMLMFGPKNAPAKQTHYLYLPMKSSVDGGSGKDKEDTAAIIIGKQVVPKGVIMIITQFDGIPMADCFKIVQYFSFDRGAKPGSLTARIGVHVHFVKYTMLKAQVRDGVKEELSVLAQKWAAFANTRVSKVAGGTLGYNLESAGTVPSPVVGDVSGVAEGGLKADTPTERKKSFDETSQQKDKKASRRLPKILFSEEKEKNTLIGILKSIARAVLGFFEVHLESRLASVLVVCLLLVVTVQWRHNGAMSKRVEAFESAMQRMERSLVSHGDDHRQLVNTVEKLSQSHLGLQSDLKLVKDFVDKE